MNLILFAPDEINRPLPRGDRRAVHLLQVLRRRAGDTFDAGVINGARGKATLTTIDEHALTFAFSPDPASDRTDNTAASRIVLIVGLPRPQTARDILRDATTLGVAALNFVRTEKSESSYAQSTLWSTGEWRRHVLAGAEQAFSTHLPEVTFGGPLADAVANTSSPTATRLALDNYEAPAPLGTYPLKPDTSVVLAIGAERGWSAAERGLLRAHGFTFAHLGSRVLRTETACTAALAIVRAKLGLM